MPSNPVAPEVAAKTPEKPPEKTPTGENQTASKVDIHNGEVKVDNTHVSLTHVNGKDVVEQKIDRRSIHAQQRWFNR